MTESQTKDTYRGPRHQGEYDRLRTQHDLVKTAMHGKLLYCPADLIQSNLRILDSATAEGTWLIDLAQSVPSSASLFGTDIAPQHFVPEGNRPANVHLSTHSTFDPWPADFQGSFDIVHQRFVLTVGTNDTAQEAVKMLFSCVKPGGWIELHEGNMLSIQEGPDHKAFMKFRDIMVNAWAAIGNQPSPGSFLVPWLKEAGAVDIQEDIQTIKVGAASEDKEQGERAVSVLLHLLDGMKMMLSGKLMNIPVTVWFLLSNVNYRSTEKPGQPTRNEFDELRKDLEVELRTVGNVYYYHLAWARKELAN
ncbi:hypothetical protein N7486_004415 [Penicillium sp. IBT 16267x]|nr:hypothetical protein N7486_004415 [Penicillium sp. IBT 16267x]